MLEVNSTMIVPFHDVDSMGIVWHGRYLKYFEVARCELLDYIGFGYREMAHSDYSWPVIDARIKYVQPIIFEQKIIISAMLKEYDLRLKINYLIKDAGSSQRLTKGHTIQTAVSRSTNEICLPLPKVFTEKLDDKLTQK